MKWRSAWRHLLLSVLFISPSSLSACHRGCFLSLVAVVGLIGVMGLYGNVEIDVAVRLRWRSVRWVWVGSDRVFFFFFFLVVVVACVWVVKISVGLVVVWFLGLVVAWWPVSCGCGVWLAFS